ncbi:MAG: glycoside hydrolase family 3 C-terminal domain-containing protein [Bacteroidetes bacterium]|nr:glycoside hydrolase family 3 C-terminal domain-containing protein [Bacteroidota bacterium]
MKNIILLFSVFFFAKTISAQNLLPYKNASLPVEERVKDLLSRMTPEEKFWQLFMIPGEIGKGDEEKYKNGIFGFQVSAASSGGGAAQQMLHYGTSENALLLAKKINSIQKYFIEKTRLGIPMIAFDEALHGLVREGATVFPQSIGLAATWDTLLVQQVAHAIAEEARQRGIRQILSPVINIASDVRWGRTEETYGEDPFLTSAIGVAFMGAFERMNIVTTPKHFIANVGDGGRDSYPIHFNERILDEIYFPPFKAAIEKAGARSMMTAYNSLDGKPCSANDWLLTKKLKREWGFKGFVISDASAVGGANVLHYTSKDYPTSGQQAITAGLDVIFQTAYDHYRLFIDPFLNGDIDKKRIDDAVSRVLRAKFELGLFEHPYVEENNIDQSIIKEHKGIAEKAAKESMVLLKNEKDILPFSKHVKSIALIGTDAVEARLGGYSGPGNGKINILDGIRQRAGNSINVSYAPGCGRYLKEWVTIPDEYLSYHEGNKTVQGLKGEYYNNISFAGKPNLTRTDRDINFQWTLFSPDPAVDLDFYSVRWTGKLRSPLTGHFKIGLDGNDGYRLYINNKLLVDHWSKQSYHTLLQDFFFEENKEYDIRVEFYEPVGNAHIKLIWNQGITDETEKKIKEAVEAAKQADIALVVAGIEEGEFRDRAMLTLPGKQEELIKRVAATGKPLVVLLVGGSAVVMNNWIDDAQGIVDLWYPGEEGGKAVAAILFGDANPAGRLPITFPLSESQLPLVYNHKPTGRGDDYNNLSGLPLFPFGYGLSYTKFEYSNLQFSKNNIANNDSVIVKFKLTNRGSREGDEVTQLYIRDLLSSVARPVMELKGFQRVHLMPGETKQISFLVGPSALSMLDENLKEVVEPGDFKIMIGASSRDIRLKGILTVTK